MTKRATQQTQKNFLLAELSATALLALIFCLMAIMTSDFIYGEKIAYGIHVGSVDIGGKTTEQATELLTQGQIAFLRKDILLRYKDQYWSLNPIDIDLQFNTTGTIEQAYAIGRTSRILQSRADRLLTSLNQKRIPLLYTYDKAKLNTFLNSIQLPTSFDVEQYVATTEINDRVDLFSPEYVDIVTTSRASDIEKRDRALTSLLADELSNTKLTFQYQEKSWEVSQHTLRDWIHIEIKSITDIRTNDAAQLLALPASDSKLGQIFNRHIEDVLHTSIKNNVRLFVLNSLSVSNKKPDEKMLVPAISQEKVTAYLQQISQEIGKPPVDARFHMRDGKLEVSKKSELGLGIDTATATQQIPRTLSTHDVNTLNSTNTDTKKIALETIPIQARINENDPVITNNITELVGVGKSNMGHSSGSRVHNVSLGASRFDGLVIAPGEEVSAGKTIDDVDQAHGFVPELVILEGKTVPQDGGGLCQVATTLFRSVMDGGLAVTQRRNHSYAVSYYAPQGTDATIYYPATDFKFRNDTSSYLLIQTFVEGMDVRFEIFGTKDGRTVEIATPYTYDRKPDGSMKAKWARRVIKNGQTIHDDVFLSVYRSPNDYPRAAN